MVQKRADSTLAMRRSVYDRAIAGELSKLKLAEVTPQRLKRLCDEVKEKRRPAVAVHVREVVLLVFRYAQGSGLHVSNPAESIRTSAIATFEPRDRALSPSEVRAVLAALDHVTAAPTLRSVTGSKNAWRTRTVGPRVGSTTRPNTSISAAT
jgi:integrase